MHLAATIGGACFSGRVLSTPSTGADRCTTCSELSAQWAEPLPGTAAVAGFWLCLEQRGPWGRSAVTESHLDRDLGAELLARAENAGVRVQLIRRPGPHADAPGPRRAYLANTDPAAGWLRSADLDDPAELLELDLQRVAAGHHDDWGRPDTGPLLLVCTNGRRDRCCALRGRALVSALAGHGETVWETTHTGGHRFAPAAVLLPSGYTYGRITADDAGAALSAAAAGKLSTTGCRGRSTWSRAGQAAELAVRRALGEDLLDVLRVERAGEVDERGRVRIRVRHRDRRSWTVEVARREPVRGRPTSCGGAEALPDSYVAGSVFVER